MKSFSLFLWLALISLPSCFVADSLFIEEEPQLALPFDVIVKDSVYLFIQKNKKPDEKYLSYGYEPLKIIVPQIIKEKEKWEGRRGVAGFDPAVVEQKIAEKDSIIKQNNLKKKISIDHTFSLRDINDSVASVQEVNFILSNELNVIDYNPIYQASVTEEEERIFAKFLYETPILKAYSYSESQELSESFYNFFKEEWGRKNNSLDKSRFLKHTLFVVKEVDEINLFDVQQVSQASLKNYIKANRTDIENYSPLDFSPLYEINEDDTLTGYYFFHTFMFLNEEEAQKMSVYVKFNPFYEVERIVETNQVYDVYEK
ncbi:MAG: hypothetical protein AB8B72_01185 [Crocinitomicaceae bacterium]